MMSLGGRITWKTAVSLEDVSSTLVLRRRSPLVELVFLFTSEMWQFLKCEIQDERVLGTAKVQSSSRAIDPSSYVGYIL
jgi:hypothetical protein